MSERFGYRKMDCVPPSRSERIEGDTISQFFKGDCDCCGCLPLVIRTVSPSGSVSVADPDASSKDEHAEIAGQLATLLIDVSRGE